MSSIFKTTGILALTALTLAACSQEDSENIRTEGIVARYSVRASNTPNGRCVAAFWVGGDTGTSLRLQGDDQVTCNGQNMGVSDTLGALTYSTSSAGPHYLFRFEREGEDYRSSVVLPETINVVTPAATVATVRVVKGNPIDVRWVRSTQSNDSMRVELSYRIPGEPAQFVTRSVTDSAPENGLATFTRADTRGPENAPLGTWTAELRLLRVRPGQMAPGLRGSIEATQEAKITLELVDAADALAIRR